MTTATGDKSVLAIICGTQSVRARLIDARGDIVVNAQKPLYDGERAVAPQTGY
jgi:sugar (pentulose or hexulose) kinase